jgi:hypothetical protein
VGGAAVLKPQTIAEQILFSTLRIEAHGPGANVSIGTGFFFGVHPPERPDLQLLLLVTNKHVVVGSDRFNSYATEISRSATTSFDRAA